MHEAAAKLQDGEAWASQWNKDHVDFAAIFLAL